MSDQVAFFGALAAASAAFSAGGLYRAARAGAKLVGLERPRMGQALDQAFRCADPLPDDMRALLDKLD